MFPLRLSQLTESRDAAQPCNCVPALKRHLPKTFKMMPFLFAIMVSLLLCASSALGVDSVAPPWSGGSSQVSVQGNTAVLRYSNGTSFTQYTWQCPSKLTAGQTMPAVFGPVAFEINSAGRNQGPVDIHSYGSIQWTQPMTFLRASLSTTPESATCRLQFRGSPNANMVITASLAGPTLQFDVSVDQKIVQKLVFPLFSLSNRQPVKVPYVDVQYSYFPDENVFGMQFLDWVHTNATSQTGMTAIYSALTNGSYNLVKERGFLAVSNQLDDLFPNIPNPPSPYMQVLAGRVVIDLWGGSFEALRNRLQDMAAHGILNGVVIIHDWGFAGYDAKSPLYRPANSAKGGDAELNKLIQEGYRDGHLVALHQNYVDYYPDYPSFNPSDVALNSDGTRQKAWYNDTSHLQSFWTKPPAMLAEATTDGRGTYQDYKTNASYIDVNSSLRPGIHVDMDASQPGAGMQVTFSNYTAKLWQAERDIHHGPVFGEGGSNWYWSGLLDGVEVNFGAGWPNNEGPQAPLLVDFDLLRIHPLQVNHGMGYYSRWSPNMAKRILLDNEVDLYRAQEVAFGHAPFIDKVISVIEKDLYSVNEYSLVTPVAKRYGTAKVSSIKYYVNDRWVDTSTAFKNGAPGGQYRTVLIAYDNGLQVVANAGPELHWNNYDIPQYGWVARGDGVEAGTILKNGTLVDFASSPEELYAHVREASLEQEQQEMLQPTPPQNSRPVLDFGNVRTNGIALLTHDDHGWALYTLPQGPSTTLALKSARVAAPAEVQCRTGATGSAKTQRQADSWSFQPIPKCTAYRW